MENNMPKKPGLFARMFGKSWEEAVQEIESIRAKLEKEKATLDQREAALIKRENELAKKESELAKRRNELQKREAKVREQEKKYKRKEKTRERITPKEVERLEIQPRPQVEVYVGPKVEEVASKVDDKNELAQFTYEVVAEPIAEIESEQEEIQVEEPKAEEKLEIVEDFKVKNIEVVEEPATEKLEIVEEPEAEKLEIIEEPKVEKLEVVEQPKAEEIKTEKVEAKPQKNPAKKAKVKSQPQKVAEYSEELNDKRNSAMLEAIKELNERMEKQLKLDDIQAATVGTRSPEGDAMVKKRRTANVATIRGYLFGLIAAYLDTLPEEDIKYIEIEGMTSTDFLRYLAADYEFDFQRDEDNTKSLAISKNGNFASNRFIYGAMGGYGKITKEVIENENYFTEVMGLANNWLVGSYLDETLDTTAPNMRKGLRIDTQKLAKRDERLEKEFGEAGQVL